MIAVAAIDLMDGRAVQLVQGDPDAVRCSDPDPVAVARHWAGAGFRRLHLVDLDAALGRGDNRKAARAVIEAVHVPIQVGGGVRDRATARVWLEAGADRVVVGTRAVAEPGWGRALAREHPGRVVVAADVRGGEVVTHGWTERSGTLLETLLAAYADTPLAAVLVTDVGREGRLQGADSELFAAAVAAASWPLIAAGSITDPADLERLAEAGIAEAVLGMSLYTGTMTPEQIRPWLTPASEQETDR